MNDYYLSGSIVDMDTQYTQQCYEELKTLVKKNGKLTVWKNDIGIAQIVLLSFQNSVKNISIQATKFIDREGNKISTEHVSFSFVHSTLAYNGPFLGYGDPNRSLPPDDGENRSESSDILVEGSIANLGENQLLPVFIQLFIPEETKAGDYRLSIEVKAKDGTSPLIFTYEVIVLDLVLPLVTQEISNFHLEMWQYPYSSAEYYNVVPFSEDHFRILEPIMKKYIQVGGQGITASVIEEAWAGQTFSENPIHYPSMIKWCREKDGSFSFDYTVFDKWIHFNRSLGLKGKIVLYSLAPWHQSFTYWEGEELIYEPYEVGSSRYKDVWTFFLNDLIEHLMSKGWFEETFIGIDERGFHKEAFDLIEQVKNIYTHSLKTTGAMDRLLDYWDLALRVDYLSIGDTAAAEDPTLFSELVNLRKEKRLPTTLYSCTEHAPGNFSLSAPVESYWSVLNAGKETDGFLRWAYDAWVKDPLEDATHNAFEPGDTFFIYPDKKNALIPKVHSSIRLERMAEAVRDVRKLKKLIAYIPQFQEVVDKMYKELGMDAKISHSYLTKQEITLLSQRTKRFKQELNNLSQLYLMIKHKRKGSVLSVNILTEIDEMVVGDQQQLIAQITPAGTIYPKLNWTSSNERVIQISLSGEIIAKSPGVAQIRANSVLEPEQADFRQIIVRPEEGAAGFFSQEQDCYEMFLDEKWVLPLRVLEQFSVIKSSEVDVLTIDSRGIFTGHQVGKAKVFGYLNGGNKQVLLTMSVKKRLPLSNTLPVIRLPEKYLTTVERAPGTDRQYLGQPDLIQTKTGRLISAYPKGHGKGPIIMQVSDDLGESWEEQKETPVSWIGSQETPTLYRLSLANGLERLLLITSCPGWGVDTAGNRYGWNTSYSDDDGETWTEYRHWHSDRSSDKSPNDVIVGMASLVQLRDKEGEFTQRWLGVYHDGNYINYKTYLTFDKENRESWSEPEPFLKDYRLIEKSYQICEIGLFRSPNQKRILGLCRSQSHNHPATLIISSDEGESWSEPMDLPGSLAGERHKAIYDPISQRLIISFREIFYDLNQNQRFDGEEDWIAGDWGLWVGTYEQLCRQKEGEYRVLVAEDWSNNVKSGDTGYAGIVALEDGTLIMHSYGHWDKLFSEQWQGGVTTDLSYIKQAKFKLSDLDKKYRDYRK